MDAKKVVRRGRVEMTDNYITRAAAAHRKENEMEKEILYKVLEKDNSAFHGGVGQWNLPQNSQPGDWMPPIQGELIPCENGYHLCRPKDLLDWLGPVIFEAEYRGERLDCHNKVVVREARLLRKTGWNKRVARLFACDCAERVLDVFKCENPDDGRPREAIETARRFANGEATRQELAAASAAAETAARAAASAAAGAAARAVAWASERVTAWAAAEAAAGIAVEATVGAAAEAAERQWQQEHLLSYIQGGSG